MTSLLSAPSLPRHHHHDHHRRRRTCFPPTSFPNRPLLARKAKATPLRIAADSKTVGGDGRPGRWRWVPFAAGQSVLERILRSVAGTTPSPVGQFVSSPATFLHSVDARVKLVWLLALVVLPARSSIVMRFGLVVFLALLTICFLPKHVWRDQLGRVALISGVLFIMLGLGADGAPSLTQLRTPPPALEGLPNIPVGGYSYSIIKLGPIQLTRKGFSVASTSASLAFTIFQSAALCLTTTTPEQLALAFEWFMTPLKALKVSVAEIVLTLLLSLRFIGLVSDEVRNTAMAIVSRRINWQQLTFMDTLDIFGLFIQRIFKNIFKHADQISQAMIVRGFRGDSNTHKIYTFASSSFSKADIIALICLLGVLTFMETLANIYRHDGGLSHVGDLAIFLQFHSMSPLQRFIFLFGRCGQLYPSPDSWL